MTCKLSEEIRGYAVAAGPVIDEWAGRVEELEQERDRLRTEFRARRVVDKWVMLDPSRRYVTIYVDYMDDADVNRALMLDAYDGHEPDDPIRAPTYPALAELLRPGWRSEPDACGVYHDRPHTDPGNGRAVRTVRKGRGNG